MTTEVEINKQLEGDYNRFYAAVFDGELPSDLIERFKKALMALAPAATKYNTEVIKKIISKRVNELSVMDVGVVINAVFSVPFGKVYENIESALDKNIELELIREKYNKAVDEIKIKLSKKKVTLMNIAGIGNSAPFKLTKAEA